MKTLTSEEYHNRIAATYNERYESAYWRLFNEITQDTLEAFRPPLPCQRPILDAGGGTGTWSAMLAELGYSVVWTDTAKAMKKQAGKKIEASGLSDSVTVETPSGRFVTERLTSSR